MSSSSGASAGGGFYYASSNAPGRQVRHRRSRPGMHRSSSRRGEYDYDRSGGGGYRDNEHSRDRERDRDRRSRSRDRGGYSSSKYGRGEHARDRSSPYRSGGGGGSSSRRGDYRDSGSSSSSNNNNSSSNASRRGESSYASTSNATNHNSTSSSNTNKHYRSGGGVERATESSRGGGGGGSATDPDRETLATGVATSGSGKRYEKATRSRSRERRVGAGVGGGVIVGAGGDYPSSKRSVTRSPPPRDTESPSRFGDWSEHTSSTGKKYYYNAKSEVSQWEKPSEWLEWERRHEQAQPSPLLHPAVAVQQQYEQLNDKSSTTPTQQQQLQQQQQQQQQQSMQLAKLQVQDASPVSEDSSISSNDDDDGGQTPETREADEMTTIITHDDNNSLSQKPQFLPGMIPSRDQVMQDASSPLSERSPSPTSSQGDQTPPRGDKATLSTTLLPPPVKPITLSPSLAKYYKEVLITHMTAWQAEQLERQATRLQSELFTLASVHCSAISADLKMARSMVRLAEIQATLQEQRALFLQQQIAQLEEKSFSQPTNGSWTSASNEPATSQQ